MTIRLSCNIVSVKALTKLRVAGLFLGILTDEKRTRHVTRFGKAVAEPRSAAYVNGEISHGLCMGTTEQGREA